VPSSDAAFEALADEAWQPSLIISDVALPRVDGYEFLRRLRASRWSALPVIALTAYARDEDRRHALEAGFAAHIAKPATAEVLNEAVRTLLRKN
jgi:CheY-like chemotaxis protein